MSQPCWCGSLDYQIIISNQAVRCRHCGLVRTEPEPAEQKKDAGYYVDPADYLYRLNNLKLWQQFAKDVLKIIKKYKSQGALLDVGANIGVLVAEAVKNGYDAQGLDICQESVEAGNKLFNLGQRLTFAALPETNWTNQFEIIVYNHVLEHLKDSNRELTAAYQALKAGGLIYLAVPNFNSVWRRVLGRRWRGLATNQHYWQFEATSLQKILEHNHFKVLKTYRNRNILYNLTFTPAGLAKILLVAWSKLFKQGDNLIILAQKN